MSTKQPDTQDRNAPPLNEETNPQPIPSGWLADAPDATLADGETRYYAVLATIERSVSTDADVLAGHKQGRAEDWTVHVLYTRADGQRRVSQDYPASVTETGDGLHIEPRGLWASIAVDGDHITPVQADATEEITHALNELHDIEVQA